MLPHPIGGKRKSAAFWAERGCSTAFAGRNRVCPLKQAMQEVRYESCDAAECLDYVESLDRYAWRCRVLQAPSPFAEAGVSLWPVHRKSIADAGWPARALTAAGDP